MAKKERIDVLLVQQGYYDSREKAKRAVMAGLVFSQSGRIDKPGEKVALDTQIQVKGAVMPYVSRGGLKLEKAIKVFDIDITGKIVLDVGASTGGFTDCALQHGAYHVYALDVGYGQLDWKLRQDERVTVMEKTNFRYVETSQFSKGTPNFACMDVSFISIKLLLPILFQNIEAQSQVICLVKPQFEAGREQVGKKGVVKDPAVHEDVLKRIMLFAEQVGFTIKDLSFSPITGGEGNIEFLLYLAKDLQTDIQEGFLAVDRENESNEEMEQNLGLSLSWINKIHEVIQEAHAQFDKKE